MGKGFCPHVLLMDFLRVSGRLIRRREGKGREGNEVMQEAGRGRDRWGKKRRWRPRMKSGIQRKSKTEK